MYCGNDLRKIHPRLNFERPEDGELCETCQSLGKKISYEYYPKSVCRSFSVYALDNTFRSTYHGYIQSQGDRFTNPDLAIAFDSTLFESHIPSWTTTIKEAVRRKIPTIFTVSFH